MLRTLFFVSVMLVSQHSVCASWHEFEIVSGDQFGFGVERLAILLHAEVDGNDCWVQLDTGAPAAFMWHRSGTQAPTGPSRVRVRLGGLERYVDGAGSETVPAAGQDCLRRVVGTVGNEFFEAGTLRIDLKRKRYSYSPGSTLSGIRNALPMRYLRNASGGQPLLAGRTEDGREGWILIDTGSARFGLVTTDEDQWKRLSGGLPLTASERVRMFSFTNVIDKDALTCYETDVADVIDFGHLKLRPQRVSYCQGKSVQLEVPLIGVLGLLPLEERCITLDYVSQRWQLTEDCSD